MPCSPPLKPVHFVFKSFSSNEQRAHTQVRPYGWEWIMDRNNNLHRRRSIRLRDYNYAQAGMYFVTICTQKHLCFFGDIVNGKMQLNAAGEMIQKWFLELANKFHDIRCGEFVCMPNHVHFIVINTGVDLCVHPDREHASVGANLCVRPT